METLSIPAKEISSRLKAEGFESYAESTSVFIEQMQPNEFLNFQDLVSFKHKESVQGTTILVKDPIKASNREDDYEVGYFNDDYDIVANVPFKESFKMKVKIKSVSRMEPNISLDLD
ncbi:MAG: hypothetical protein U5L09_08865 [Bacteroidales bacterium]|nr:hypothetical protein [Bacteroidales bacterium]